MRELLRQIVEADPDVIFIDLENPNRDVLEQMFQVSRSVRRPIAMFVDRSDTASIEAAIDAGVSAYVVDGLRKERVKPILDMTISRFNAFNRLREELDRTKQALEDRKVIEKAKGILMKTRAIPRGGGLRAPPQDRDEREPPGRRGGGGPRHGGAAPEVGPMLIDRPGDLERSAAAGERISSPSASSRWSTARRWWWRPRWDSPRRRASSSISSARRHGPISATG